MKTPIKKLLILIAFISIGYCNESNYDFTGKAKSSFSFGLFSEKMGINFFEASALFNIDKKSEYYLSGWTLIMGSGLGAGYKKYLKFKNNYILFLNAGSHFSLLGTLYDGMFVTGFTFSSGRRIEVGKIRDNFINIGLSLNYMIIKESFRKSNQVVIFPFINLERRI